MLIFDFVNSFSKINSPNPIAAGSPTSAHLIAIESADPGYDWIFSRNPAGLITKYGGVASHMAIRCAEVGLPAAIGLGELIFEKLFTKSKINIDCQNETIIIMQDKSEDPYFKEKQVLKSLGYIK